MKKVEWNVSETATKNMYRNLTFPKMREYIKTQPNSEENLAEMEMVIEIAEAKNAKSPFAKRKRLSIKDIAD